MGEVLPAIADRKNSGGGITCDVSILVKIQTFPGCVHRYAHVMENYS